jgi:hypothetical protein
MNKSSNTGRPGTVLGVWDSPNLSSGLSTHLDSTPWSIGFMLQVLAVRE